MNRTRHTLFPFLCLLLLCSCSSVDKAVKISLYDTYVTGSFVRPTTPDKVRVYVDNEPLPMSTEVIGEFGVIDPVSKRNASLDVLLDTIKKDASYLGANGLFLAEYNKPKWYECYSCHSLYGFVLLQPDTIVKPNREHPLNTSYREALERNEAKRLEIKKNTPSHFFHLSAGYMFLDFEDDVIASDLESRFTNGLGVQGSYEYNISKFHEKEWFTLGLLYNGYFAKASLLDSRYLYDKAMMVNHSLVPVISARSNTGKHCVKLSHGLGYQWENIYLMSGSSDSFEERLSTRRTILYYGVGYEYSLHKHLGLAVNLHAIDWGVPNENGYSDKETHAAFQCALSLGLNYHF